jgi:hypothetical protein
MMAALVGAISVAVLAILGFCRGVRLPGGRRSAWSLAWMSGAMALMAAAMGDPALLRHAPTGLPLLFLVLVGAGLYCAARWRWARGRHGPSVASYWSGPNR